MALTMLCTLKQHKALMYQFQSYPFKEESRKNYCCTVFNCSCLQIHPQSVCLYVSGIASHLCDFVYICNTEYNAGPVDNDWLLAGTTSLGY